ncbi:glycosyltransferase family 25 protein [Thermothielavioides terrestris NRRL 8126]|uniref:Glycosyltransferase family 25 protein n=1 Tax=Thermothielavioides terrestris (strain ATCC 38088 / NRRL 8126) TaxID=578455 RepID=G2QYY5_THETT|nr:glycosyltransferase family 25 protein [Thermothielavioides terrestris NRRL 8126]AEO67124.1 glycosyltransferase family 25 protein [Thermothielavioides terrestris NRRL 8126]
MGDICNSTLGFEKIFIIGLPSRSDRRDGIVLQAALSGIQVEFIDGVLGKDVPDKAIPMASPDSKRLDDGAIGCWRAHMNAVREIVHRNLTSALILEDDADWDIRIRDQLRDFALAAHALTQPLRGRPGVYADPTYPTGSGDEPVTGGEMDFYHLPATEPPTTSPYGDDWDLLWIGHCGMHFPFPQSKTVPKARVIRVADETVAPKKNLWTINIPFTLKEKYPAHTRAYHHVQEGVCTLGYALSRRGARRLLREVALREVGAPYDLLLRAYCEGDRGRAPGRQCLTTQPSLFHHHRAAGPVSAMSDISDHGRNGEFRETAMTDMVRWSVRLNADALMEGRTDFVDQYPDE